MIDTREEISLDYDGLPLDEQLVNNLKGVLEDTVNPIKMKKKIFDEYLDRALKASGLTIKELFAETKAPEVSEVRQAFYHACRKRPMRIVTIQALLKDVGQEVNKSTIHYGVNRVIKRLRIDEDYKDLYSKIIKKS